MSIDKLAEFAKDGDKNLDNLDVSKGFLQSEKPERQWFNKLFGDITGKINQLIEVTDISINFDNVEDMIADTTIVSGKVVSTNGYHAKQDGGGAKYTVSSVPTDYSIPLNNGLHAIFNDTFDIRKFGIINNGLLDQTDNIRRMVAYADSREYVIDFHGFTIMTPKTYTYLATRGGAVGEGYPVMGMGFKYVHDIKNLSIVHNKTARLVSGQQQIVFAPMSDAESESWFKLTNVEFDPWVANYQPYTENYMGNYDGMRLGFLCHPHFGSTLPQWNPEPSNYSFEFNDINFKSAAYSYNLSTSAIHAKNIRFKKLIGEYLGLYLNYMAQNLEGESLTTVFRDDRMESGRGLVNNAVHYEAELAGKTAAYKSVKLKDIDCKKSDGTAGSSCVYRNIGTTSIDYVELDNIVGHNRFEGVTLGTVKYKNSNKSASIVLKNCPDVTNLYLENWSSSYFAGSYGSAAIPLSTAKVDNIFIDRCKLVVPLSPRASTKTVNILKIEINNTDIYDNDGVITGENITIDNFAANNITTHSAYGRVLDAKIGQVGINNLVQRKATGIQNTLSNMVANKSTAKAIVNITNIVSDVANFSSFKAFDGNIDLSLVNAVFKDYPLLGTGVNIVNKVAVYPKLQIKSAWNPDNLEAGATQSHVVAVAGAKLGELYKVSFEQSLQGTRMWAEVTAAGQVTVWHQNPTSASVNLNMAFVVITKDD